jgi:hypothetical protein
VRSPFFLLALLSLVSLAACERVGSRGAAPARPSAGAAPQSLVLPRHGLYTGAYIDFGEHEDDVTLEKIEAFEKMVGKRQAIIASSSYWGEQSFPEANVRLIARHGAVPLVFWSPWDRPYIETRGPDRYSLTSIIAGEHDAYIDRWAEAAHAFGHLMIVSLGNEMKWVPARTQRAIRGRKPSKPHGGTSWIVSARVAQPMSAGCST